MVFRLTNRICLGALFIVAAAIASPSLAFAQSKAEIEMARNLMDEGDAQAEKGDFRGALRSYRAAHTIMNVPTTGIEVARTEAKLGSLIEARKVALAIVNLPAKPREPKPFVEARADAQQLAVELGVRIPQLTIVVKGVPETTQLEVKIDGRLIPHDEALAPRDVDPGKHLVSVAKQGSEAEIKTIMIAESEKLTVTFDGVATPTGSDKPTRRTSPLVFIGFGLGGAGLIAGAVTGALSLSRAGDVEALCPGGTCPSQDALDKATPTNDSAFALANVSNVAIALGVVGVGLGVTGLVLSGRAAKKPEDTSALQVFVGPNGALLTGTF
ncbi:MAG: hypothetical protein IPM54_35845 [Polyangiaceae bacterium]|nr:hypothetical protein [Polyangiaceae bacterium]